MSPELAALMDEVHRARSEALQARRLAIITTDARAVESLNALADESDARAEAEKLARRAAATLAPYGNAAPELCELPLYLLDRES